MDKFLQAWRWKWPQGQSTKEFLYLFENEQSMILEVKEKSFNGEKYCEWLRFDKVKGEIEPLQFKSMSPNRREFSEDITLEWNGNQARLKNKDAQEVFEIKMAK